MDLTGVREQVRGQHGSGRRRPRRRSIGDKGFEQDHQEGPCGLGLRSRSTALNFQEAKSVQTPGEDEKSWQEEEDRERMNNQDASQYRNYLAWRYAGCEQPHPR